VGFAIAALLPREYLTLGADELERFGTWSEPEGAPEQVRGRTMRTLIAAITFEQRLNLRKAQAVSRSFTTLVIGLILIAAEAAILAAREVT
jgi:hypothetical protein